jgi:O-glycosyl hydrolase
VTTLSSRPSPLLIPIVALMVHGVAHAAEKVSIRIDPTQKHQVMRGFGASGAWWPSWVGEYPQEKQDQLLDLLFSDRGIALSIYRYNIPAGGGSEIRRPERATVKVESAPGQYDLSADLKALEILRGVRKRGVERFVLFANSPPGRLTCNGLTSGGEGGGSNLRPGAEEAFAEYLIDLATRIRDEYDLPHVTVSPINEPQWKWGEKGRGQEGCHYTAQEAAAVIRAVVEVSQRRKTGFIIEAPESGQWDKTLPYAEAMFADPVIDRHVEELAIHSYWTDPAARRRAAQELQAKFPYKRIAMTEFCIMQRGHELGIDSAIEMAQVIHDDLTVGNVVHWQWWLGVAMGGYQDGLIYAHPKTQKIEPTKRLWVLGQYSRFVRPGYTRIAATGGDERLKTTAFLSADGRRLVCVIINPADQSTPAAIAAPDFAATRSSLWTTDNDRDLAHIDHQEADVILPPRSVSTLVLER